MTTTKPQEDNGTTVLYRLDLPSELAEALAAQAERNERSLPGQIRYLLREWHASQAQPSA